MPRGKHPLGGRVDKDAYRTTRRTRPSGGVEAPAFDTAMPILSQLLKAEMAERDVRFIAYHMKAARLKPGKLPNA